MKVNTQINGKDISIVLTKEQIDSIKKQTEDKPTVNGILNIDDAHQFLRRYGKEMHHIQFTESNFCRNEDWIRYQLFTIIKVLNYIENGYEKWNSEFDSKLNYLPYFKKDSDGVWSVHDCDDFSYFSYAPLSSYYISSKLAINSGKKLIELYQIYLNS